jgi:hypothetical protein
MSKIDRSSDPCGTINRDMNYDSFNVPTSMECRVVQPRVDSETLDWLEKLLVRRLDYILDPAPVADEPSMPPFYAIDDDDTEGDSDDEDDEPRVQMGQFCANCHRLEQRHRFTPVVHLIRTYPWRSQPDLHKLIYEVRQGRCHFLTTVPDLIDYLLELIYRRVLGQQEAARLIIGRLPFRHYLYRPGMPGSSRSQSRLQYQNNLVPAPANQLSLEELRQRVRQMANRLDAVDAAAILMAYGEKYHLSLT